MRFVRRWRAWIVLVASVIGAAFIYNHRVSGVVVVRSRYDDPHRLYRVDEHLSAQPWWSTPAAVLLLALGIALFVRLLPARVRLLRICTSRLTPRF